MKKEYDFVYLTNTPSFYKLNLCNEISRTNSVLLVLYGYGSEAVNTVLKDNSGFRFDHVFINEGDSNRRNKFKVLRNLFKLMRGIRCKRILYSGWMTAEYNIYSFFSKKKRNVLVCESSVFDTSFNGLKGMVKRAIVGRMDAVLPSGEPHAELFRQIGFKGACNITGSVGIFNKGERDLNRKVNTPLRYLYVGRLIDVKNVGLLIDVFNRNGQPLTIVGDGVLRDELQKKANDNITFTGFIDNEKLGMIYQSHDVFVLPSYSETWGLVVEEALYWGLPVIVSDRVGSSVDMVDHLDTGLKFVSEDAESLQKAITQMNGNYNHFLTSVRNIDWISKDRHQIKAYLSLV